LPKVGEVRYLWIFAFNVQKKAAIATMENQTSQDNQDQGKNEAENNIVKFLIE